MKRKSAVALVYHPQTIRKFVIWSKVAIDLTNSTAEDLQFSFVRRISIAKRSITREEMVNQRV